MGHFYLLARAPDERWTRGPGLQRLFGVEAAGGRGAGGRRESAAPAVFQGPAKLAKLAKFAIFANFKFCKNFGRLVLGCIKTNFCKKICV